MNLSLSEINPVKPGNELEYTALRAEILKRIELRQQLMSITLTLAGAFLGFGLSASVVAFIYPLVALFLTMLWAQNDIRSRQIGKYLQLLEKLIPGLGWETYYRQQTEAETRLGSWPLSILAPGGTFLVTSFVAIGVGVARFASTALEWILLTMSGLATIFILYLLVSARRQSKKYRQ